MRLVAFVALTLMVASALAGCTDSGTSKAGRRNVGGEGSVVGGQVLDEEGLPIGAALITVAYPKNLSAYWQALSDERGAYTLGTVPAGDWFLTVNATGYEPYQRTLKVFAGHDQAQLNAILRAIPVPEPWKLTTPGSIIIQYGLAWQVGGDFNQGCIYPGVTCNAYVTPDPNVHFGALDPPTTPLRTLIVEETWTSTSPVCAKTMAIDIYNPDAPNTVFPSFENPHYWTNYPSKKWSTSNPIVMVIPRDEPGNSDAINDADRVKKNGGDALSVKGNWTVRHFPPGKGLTNLPADANCFTDQKFDIYWSVFYLEAAPQGFTGRPS